MSDYRIEAATREEWAQRAILAEAERDRVAREWAYVSQRNYQRAKSAEADLDDLMRAVSRVLNPAAGVTKIEPWARGILIAALASLDAGK